MEVSLQPGPGAPDGNVLDRNRLLSNSRDCTPGEENPNGFCHPAAAKAWRGPASAQQRLVDIVMHHMAEPVPVLMAKIARQGLGKSIADRVGMTGAFTLDDFHVF